MNKRLITLLFTGIALLSCAPISPMGGSWRNRCTAENFKRIMAGTCNVIYFGGFWGLTSTVFLKDKEYVEGMPVADKPVKEFVHMRLRQLNFSPATIFRIQVKVGPVFQAGHNVLIVPFIIVPFNSNRLKETLAMSIEQDARYQLALKKLTEQNDCITPKEVESYLEKKFSIDATTAQNIVEDIQFYLKNLQHLPKDEFSRRISLEITERIIEQRAMKTGLSQETLILADQGRAGAQSHPLSLALYKSALGHEAGHIIAHDTYTNIANGFISPLLVHYFSKQSADAVKSCMWRLSSSSFFASHSVQRYLTLAQAICRVPALAIKIPATIAIMSGCVKSREYLADQQAINRECDPTVLRGTAEYFSANHQLNRAGVSETHRVTFDKYPLLYDFLNPTHPASCRRATYFKAAAERLEQQQKEQRS